MYSILRNCVYRNFNRDNHINGKREKKKKRKKKQA